MTLASLLTYTTALLLAAIIPGPGVTALIARALGSGFAVAFAMATGMILGDFVFLSATVMGLAYIAQTFVTVFLIIKWLGAVYLAYIAWRIWKAGISLEDIHADKKKGIWSSLLSGLFITLGNPKPMLFYVALVPTLIDLREVGFTSFLELIAATAIVLTLVLGSYAALASRARNLMQKPKQLKLLSRISAGFIAGAATVIAFRAG